MKASLQAGDGGSMLSLTERDKNETFPAYVRPVKKHAPSWHSYTDNSTCTRAVALEQWQGQVLTCNCDMYDITR